MSIRLNSYWTKNTSNWFQIVICPPGWYTYYILFDPKFTVIFSRSSAWGLGGKSTYWWPHFFHWSLHSPDPGKKFPNLMEKQKCEYLIEIFKCIFNFSGKTPEYPIRPLLDQLSLTIETTNENMNIWSSSLRNPTTFQTSSKLR